MPAHPESQRIRSNECNGWSTRGKKAGDRPKNSAKAVEATSSTRAKKPKGLLQVDTSGTTLRKQLASWRKQERSKPCRDVKWTFKWSGHTHLDHTRTTIYCTMAHHMTSHDQPTKQERGNITRKPSKTFQSVHFVNYNVVGTAFVRIFRHGRISAINQMAQSQPKCLDWVAVEPQVQHGQGGSRHGDRAAMEPNVQYNDFAFDRLIKCKTCATQTH